MTSVAISQRALLLSAELSTIIAALKSTSGRYSGYRDAASAEDPVIILLQDLRRQALLWHDFDEIDPLEYLGPLLEIIRSGEVSGTLLGVALQGLSKMLNLGIVGPESPYAPGALLSVVDSVVSCKFQSTDRSTDEAVFHSILLALSAVVKCSAGHLLPPEGYYKVVHTCYKIGDQSPKDALLLRQRATQALWDIVTCAFRRAADFAAIPGFLDSPSDPAPASVFSPGDGGAHAHHDTMHDRMLENEMRAPVVEEATAPASASPGGADLPPLDGDTLERSGSVAPPEDATLALAMPSPQPLVQQTNKTVTPHEAVDLTLGAIVDFLIEMIGGGHGHANRAPEEKARSTFHGLEMLDLAVRCSREALAMYPETLSLVTTEAFRGVCLSAARSGYDLNVLTMACNVVMALHTFLGNQTMLQMEAFIAGVLLPLADGSSRRGGSGGGAAAAAASENPEQELALEMLLDLCCQPGFVPEMYLNTDCRADRSNVLEEVCAMLSKNSFPVGGPLSQVNVLCADGLIAVLQSLAISCVPFGEPGREDEGPRGEAVGTWVAVPSGPLPVYVDIFEALIRGELLDSRLGPVAKQLIGKNLPAAEMGLRVAAESARLEKHAKDLLVLAAEHFNRDPKKGFQFLQSVNLLPDPLTPTSLAYCLRVLCGCVQKSLIGEILGEPDDFSLKVLDAFTKSFDFHGLRIDAALRLYLDTFRLPGEAQKIGRILESFAEVYYRQAPDIFKSRDAAYVLSYSIIMLNTDLHNVKVKRKMTIEGFISNNRGINEGGNLPKEYLEQLYHGIAQQEIRISNEGGGGLLSLAHWLQIRAQCSLPRAGRVAEPRLFLQMSRDIYCLLWGPALAAFSVVLDHCETEQDIRRALEGVMLSAQMAAQFKVEEALDSAVHALSKYSAAILANPHDRRERERDRTVQAYASDLRAQLTAQCLFRIAAMHGACIHVGWRSILDLFSRFQALGLLQDDQGPEALPEANGSDLRGASSSSWKESLEGVNGSGATFTHLKRGQVPAQPGARGRGGDRGLGASGPPSHETSRRHPSPTPSSVPTPAARAAAANGLPRETSVSSGGGFLRSLVGFGTDPEADRAEVQAARQQVVALVDAFRVWDVLEASRYLPVPALAALLDSIAAAALGPQGERSAAAAAAAAVAEGAGLSRRIPGRGAVVPPPPLPQPGPYTDPVMEERASAFCIDLIFDLVTRNRDRILSLWPRVHAHLGKIITAKSQQLVSLPPTASTSARLGALAAAVTGIFRVFRRLLPYRGEEVNGPLVQTLQLLMKLDARAAWELAEVLGGELVETLWTCAAHIQSTEAWEVIERLSSVISRHPKLSDALLEALAAVIKGSPRGPKAWASGKKGGRAGAEANGSNASNGRVSSEDAPSTSASQPTSPQIEPRPASPAAAFASFEGPPDRSLVSLINYQSLLGILALYLEQASEDAARTGYVLELVEFLSLWLTTNGAFEAARLSAAAALRAPAPDDRPLPSVEHCWTSTIMAIGPMCLNPDPRLKQASCLLLQQVLQSSDQLRLPWAAWEACTVSHVIPLAQSLVDAQTGRGGGAGHKAISALGSLAAAAGLRGGSKKNAAEQGARAQAESDRTIQLAISILSKALLVMIARAADEADAAQEATARRAPGAAAADAAAREGLETLGRIWLRVLGVLERFMNYSEVEELQDLIPEALRNLMLVLLSQQILVPTWEIRDIALHEDGEGAAAGAVSAEATEKEGEETAAPPPRVSASGAPPRVSVWDRTMAVARRVSSGLTPELLLRDLPEGMRQMIGSAVSARQ